MNKKIIRSLLSTMMVFSLIPTATRAEEPVLQEEESTEIIQQTEDVEPYVKKSQIDSALENGILGDLTYEIIDGKAIITNCDDSASSIVIPDNINGYPVTSIGYRAFEYCSMLTTITIPDTVYEIGANAFCGCCKLKELQLPEGITSIGANAFQSCSGLTSVKIPIGLSELPYGVFNSCYKLASITIPSNIKTIGSRAFAECSSLATIKIEYGVNTIEEGAFGGCAIKSIDLPDSIIEIGDYAFRHDDIKTVFIPASIQSLSTDAFTYCKALSEINVSPNSQNYSSIDGVLFDKTQTTLLRYPQGKPNDTYSIPRICTSLFDNSFYGTQYLKNISIPGSIKIIPPGCFSDSAQLESVVINDGTIQIGKLAFSSCKKLSTVTISDTVNKIDPWAFIYDSSLTKIALPKPLSEIAENTFSDCTALTEVSMYDNVITIGNGAFARCAHLKKVNISKGVKTIGVGAFGESGIETINLPDSLERIEDSAFGRCPNIKSISLPDNVTYIGGNAFSFLNISSIIIPEKVSFIGYNAFYWCLSLKDIYFKGNCPQWYPEENYDRIFSASMTLNAYYPADNKDWTQDKLQNLGADKVTWIPWNPDGSDQQSDFIKNTWNVINSHYGFEYPFNYFIPAERYREVYGEAYLNAAKLIGNTYSPLVVSKYNTAMIPNSWGGNCGGMSTTIAMFATGKLNWNNYNSFSGNVFNTVNDYYGKCSESSGKIYTTFDKDSEITKLIERYQILWGSELNYQKVPSCSTYDELETDGNYYSLKNKSHIPSGNYISQVLEFIENNRTEPLLLYFAFNEGTRVCAHLMVVLPNIEPVLVENGWYKVYVYDPNRPYLPETLLKDKQALSNYQNGKGMRFIELNKDKNLWRYNGAENASVTEATIGSTREDKVRYLSVGIPELMFVFKLSGTAIPSEINGRVPFRFINGRIFISPGANLRMTDHDGNDILEVSEGTIKYIDHENANITLAPGYTADEQAENTIIIDYDPENVIIGNANKDFAVIKDNFVYSFVGNEKMTVSLNTDTQKTSIKSEDDVEIQAKISKIVEDSDNTDSVEILGPIGAGDNINIDYENEQFIIDNDIESEIGEVEVYRQEPGEEPVHVDTLVADHGEPVYVWSDDNSKVTAKMSDLSFGQEITETVDSAYSITKEPSCTEPGTAVYTALFENSLFTQQTKTIDLPALGHSYVLSEWRWSEDNSTTEAVFVCQHDESHTEVIVAKVSLKTDGGIKTYTAEVIGPNGKRYTDVKIVEKKSGFIRLAGVGRYDTSIAIADELKKQMDVEKFDNVVVASGLGYADALAGGYLAYKKNAPILIVSKNSMDKMSAYIKDNLKPDGIVYILGGYAAVSEEMEIYLEGYNVQRLAGENRYDTNIEILKAAEVKDEEIIIARGNGKSAYADSLSASASKRPILLVNSDSGLTEDQKEYLTGMQTKQYYIAGGTSAIPDSIKEQVNVYGNAERLAGGGRYETSTKIAERFNQDAKGAVLAYGGNFPDGLCGGPLAAYMNAPLLLTKSDKNLEYALNFCKTRDIHFCYVLGGEGTDKPLITDDAAKQILQLN